MSEKAVLDIYLLSYMLFLDKYKEVLLFFLFLQCFFMDLNIINFYQGVTDQFLWIRLNTFVEFDQNYVSFSNLECDACVFREPNNGCLCSNGGI